MYFSDTDDSGHRSGPDSDDVKAAVARVDRDIARLVAGLKARGIDDKVNLIIVSDHGMANVDPDNAVFLDDYINLDDTERILWTNEIVQIFPKTGKDNRLITSLQSKIKHATCWEKSRIPVRLNYNDSPRIAPIICSTEEGWVTTSHQRFDGVRKRNDRGGHGYDNKYQSMMATFIAHGPAFKTHYLAEPFANVDVYDVMCKILNLTPAKNDGIFKDVKEMLR